MSLLVSLFRPEARRFSGTLEIRVGCFTAALVLSCKWQSKEYELFLFVVKKSSVASVFVDLR